MKRPLCMRCRGRLEAHGFPLLPVTNLGVIEVDGHLYAPVGAVWCPKCRKLFSVAEVTQSRLTTYEDA
jgi:hypothetical protein